MNNPFFTIVVPTHNRSKLLLRAMKSVLLQTFKNFELIIIDDYSTDDTSQVVKEFSDSRIRYILNQRSRGACGARNTGIMAGKGKWIAFLDDDDVWLAEKLKYQYKKSLNLPHSVGLICTDYAIYKGIEKEITYIKNRPEGWVNNNILYGHSIGCLSSTCVRSDVLKSINGFDETLKANQDQDLWLRVSEKVKFSNVPKPLVLFMQEQRKDRISLNANNKLDGWISYRNKYYSKIKNDPFLRHRFESNILIYALLQKEIKISLKALPWLFLGLFLNFRSFFKIVRTIIILIGRTVASKC